MNASHLHLILNHFPVIGILLGLVLLFIFLIGQNQTLFKAAMIMYILTGIITILTYTSGEGAEEIVEHIPGIEEHMIEEHEELAEKSLILIESISLLSLISFIIYWRGKKTIRLLLILIIILSAGCAILTLYVNNSGGKIRHTEIRKNQSV